MANEDHLAQAQEGVDARTPIMSDNPLLNELFYIVRNLKNNGASRRQLRAAVLQRLSTEPGIVLSRHTRREVLLQRLVTEQDLDIAQTVRDLKEIGASSRRPSSNVLRRSQALVPPSITHLRPSASIRSIARKGTSPRSFSRELVCPTK
jgi:hypothetical protein